MIEYDNGEFSEIMSKVDACEKAKTDDNVKAIHIRDTEKKLKDYKAQLTAMREKVESLSNKTECPE